MTSVLNPEDMSPTLTIACSKQWSDHLLKQVCSRICCETGFCLAYFPVDGSNLPKLSRNSVSASCFEVCPAAAISQAV